MPRTVEFAPRRFRLLGVEVQPLTMDDMNNLVMGTVNSDTQVLVANHNLHSIYLYHHDFKMRAFYARAHYIHVDGMPIILLGRILGMPFRRHHRVTYVDWIDPLFKLANDNDWRIFYLGSRPGIGEQAAAKISLAYPKLVFETASGYFNVDVGSNEDCAVIGKIQRFRPHLLILGMGMPRQEHWIMDHLSVLPGTTILNAGAAIDYVAGAVKKPPRWAARLGFEWLFRLASEPKRLWKRYLVEPWFLFPLFLRELFRIPKNTGL